MTRPIHPLRTVHLALALVAGCPGPSGESTGSGEGSTSSAADPTTTSASPTTTAETPTSTTTSTPAPTCTDGAVDEGEACDDGNTINGDGCNNDCTISGELLWEFRSSARGSDGVRSVAVDADGSVVAGGRGSGLTRWVARFDGELTPQWERKYGEPTAGLVLGVAASEAALYVAGAVDSDGDGRDVWLARLAPDGAPMWEDTVSTGFGDDYATRAAVVGDDLVVTGLASDGDLTVIWTRRYAADGAVMWTSTHPLGVKTNFYPLGPGLAAGPQQEIVVGMYLPVGDQYLEGLIAYPSTGGEPLWTFPIPGTSGGIKAVAADPAGDLVIASADDMKLTIRRVTSAKSVAWSSDACTGRSARDVAIDSQGDIIVIGDGPGAAGDNIRLCKFTPDGALRWGRDIDGGHDDLGFTVAVDAADRIIAGGSMNSAQTHQDAWLAIFSP